MNLLKSHPITLHLPSRLAATGLSTPRQPRVYSDLTDHERSRPEPAASIAAPVAVLDRTGL